MILSNSLTPNIMTKASYTTTTKTRAIKTKTKIPKIPKTIDAGLEAITNQFALMLNIITPVSLSAISEVEAHVSDKFGNEVFAVKKSEDTYNIALFERERGKCSHHHPMPFSKLRSKAQRKSAPSNLWSCKNPGQISDARLVDGKIVCRQFLLWNGFDCSRDYFAYGNDEEEREVALEELITKPLHCSQKVCKTLFCEEEH
jgi:hypothetical protein